MKKVQILMETLGFLVIMRFSNAKYLLVEVDYIAGGGVGQEGIIRNPYFEIIALVYIKSRLIIFRVIAFFYFIRRSTLQ